MCYAGLILRIRIGCWIRIPSHTLPDAGRAGSSRHPARREMHGWLGASVRAVTAAGRLPRTWAMAAAVVSRVRPVGGCHGLFLLYSVDPNAALWSPTRRESRRNVGSMSGGCGVAFCSRLNLAEEAVGQVDP